jgi:DNA polymerase-1
MAIEQDMGATLGATVAAAAAAEKSSEGAPVTAQKNLEVEGATSRHLSAEEAASEAVVAPAQDPVAPRKTIAVIDGNSLVHRAFHAVPPTMSAPDGTPTNAVFGFIAMFCKMATDFAPWGCVVCFDKGKPRVRMEMLPQYKAQRPPMDPALRPQFPVVKDLLASMCVPVVELEGEAAGYNMLLVTGDRDMYQLSSDHVHIVSTRKGMSDVSIMTPESVADLYGGITPELVPDFYGLKGDSSDNIPGVPGIGPKKAANLIETYGSLEAVLEAAPGIKGKMGENLRAHAEDARLSKKVATIRCDAPIDFDFVSAQFPVFDAVVVREAFAKVGFSGVNTRRVLDLEKRAHAGGAAAASHGAAAAGFATAEKGGELGAAGGAGAAGAVDAAGAAGVASAFELAPAHVLVGEAAHAELNRWMEEAFWLGVDVEPAAAPAANQLALGLDDAPAPGMNLFVAHEGTVCVLQGQDATPALVALLKTGRVVAADVKTVLEAVCPRDSSEEALLAAGEVPAAHLFDVGVAGYLLDSSQASYTLESLCAQYLGKDVPEAREAGSAAAAAGQAQPEEFLGTAGAINANAAVALKAPLEAALAAKDLTSLFYEIEMPLVPVLATMERVGMAINPAELAKQSSELKHELDALAAHIHEEAGQDFTIASPKQLSHVLFDVLGLPTAGLKKTKTGYYSTNARVLDELARDHAFVREVLEWREKTKIRSTYLEALPDYVLGDARVHTTLNQTVAATGRLSSSDPNLQNIPVRSELGKRVREAFGVGEGKVFLAVDYSQIELRLLAHLSGDPAFMSAFISGEDLHAQTAAHVFGVAQQDVTPQMRSRAKAVNFGIVYGQQAWGLSQTLGISTKEAQELITSYYEAYPGVRRYLDQTVVDAKACGYATTMFGRRRPVPDIAARNPQVRAFAERTAMNHPMQGSAADIIKIAMVQVAAALRERNLRTKLILQIHDELDFEVPVEELDEVRELVTGIMERVVELKVPLVADASWGATWAEAK